MPALHLPDRVVAHGAVATVDPADPATWYYLSTGPTPQRGPDGRPLAAILETGAAGLVQLSCQLDPPAGELESLRRLIAATATSGPAGGAASGGHGGDARSPSRASPMPRTGTSSWPGRRDPAIRRTPPCSSSRCPVRSSPPPVPPSPASRAASRSATSWTTIHGPIVSGRRRRRLVRPRDRVDSRRVSRPPSRRTRHAEDQQARAHRRRHRVRRRPVRRRLLPDSRVAAVPRRRAASPVLRFLKYRNPLDHPDGERGGGYVFFDTEFSFTPEKLAEITEALQEKVQAMEGKCGFPQVGTGSGDRPHRHDDLHARHRQAAPQRGRRHPHRGRQDGGQALAVRPQHLPPS